MIASYGSGGWTPHHTALVQKHAVKKIVMAYDNDPAGETGVAKHSELIASLGVEVYRLKWPEGVKDAAEFLMNHDAAAFEALVKAVHPEVAPPRHQDTKAEEEEITMTAEGFAASYGARRYELFAIERPSAARLKATVKALPTNNQQLITGTAQRFHIDTVDFYLSRQRKSFIGEAARLFRETPEIIEADLNRLTLQAQSYVEKRLEEKMPRVTLISESDKAEGLKLGRAQDLVEQILRDIERLGLVGERANALLRYLGLTSRKMSDPLAILTLSSSGAGKSFLQDLLLSFCPPEDLIKVTSLSDKALFYKGEYSLMHKVLAVEEEAGATGAAYALRSLITQKLLTSETAIKNPLTGRHETQTSIVRGPSHVALTTTNPTPDDETLTRFFVGSVDESAEQTAAILEAQKNSHTLEGLRKRHGREEILRRHHAFQRLLKPLEVLDPFEPILGYGDKRLLFRRDNPKYQRLILAVTFVNQMRREVKRDPVTGVEYIETTLDDIAIANELFLALFGGTPADLPPPSRELLRLIRDYVHAEAQRLNLAPERVEFNRRALREALGWSEFQLRKYLRPLVEQEYLAPVAGRFGQPYCYRLLYDGRDDRRYVSGIKEVEQIRREAIAMGLISVDTPLPRGVCLSATSCTKSEPRAEKSDLVHTSCSEAHEVNGSVFPSENGEKTAQKSDLVRFSGNHIPVFGKNGESPVPGGFCPQNGSCISE